ncbi:MAG: hypothetical protein IPO92_20115 [Saprospiraceae bacterium]|nr:hypothetical protein [Saprospiraceae bacterium]
MSGFTKLRYFIWCCVLLFKFINSNVIGPCNNQNQHPADTVPLQCGTTLVATQTASEFSVTSGYTNNKVHIITSSVNTDYITIRKASDNTLITHGFGPINFNYLSSFGNIEILINQHSLCFGNSFLEQSAL